MLYSEKYPNANPRGSYEYGNYIYGKESSCYICGKPTNFIEVNADAHICSEECDKKFYDDMFLAEMKRKSNTGFYIPMKKERI